MVRPRWTREIVMSSEQPLAIGVCPHTKMSGTKVRQHSNPLLCWKRLTLPVSSPSSLLYIAFHNFSSNQLHSYRLINTSRARGRGMDMRNCNQGRRQVPQVFIITFFYLLSFGLSAIILPYSGIFLDMTLLGAFTFFGGSEFADPRWDCRENWIMINSQGESKQLR